MATTNDSDESPWKEWKKRGKLSFYGIVLAGIGFLIGLYIIAPMQPKSEGYVPKAVRKMPKATIKFINPDGGEVLLPVNIADEDEERETGLNKVGKAALGNTYLLYDQGDVTTWGEDYDVSKIKAPLSFAIINGEGKVVKIKEAQVADEEVSVEKDHRWVLAMEQEVLKEFGIKVGTQLVTKTLPGSE
ncbi:MAG: DUF192 domain-containing protein [Candidatus Bipolaricaulia bacterium]